MARVFCGELGSLTRANDYGLLWASSAQASGRADLTVKDAEEACQHLIDRSVRGVFFAPFEFAPDKDKVSRRMQQLTACNVKQNLPRVDHND